ncbi:MAG TPA: hypothetical protein VGD98_07060 [Ktedonobacteraceae bacterium]
MKRVTTHQSRRALLQRSSLSAALLAAPLLNSSNLPTADAANIPSLVGVWDIQATLQSSLLLSSLALPAQAKLIHAEVTLFGDGNLTAVSDIDELVPFRGPAAMGLWRQAYDQQIVFNAQRRALSVAGIATGVITFQGTAAPDSSGNTIAGSCNLTFTLFTPSLPVTISYALQGTRRTI